MEHASRRGRCGEAAAGFAAASKFGASGMAKNCDKMCEMREMRGENHPKILDRIPSVIYNF